MTPTIQAVAFDKDGVTFDSERIYAESLLQTLAELPQPPADAPALAEACSGLSCAATAAVLQEKLGADVDMDAFFRRWFARRDAIIATRGVPFMPGADALIEALYAEGYPLALVTADDLDNVLADFQRSAKPPIWAARRRRCWCGRIRTWARRRRWPPVVRFSCWRPPVSPRRRLRRRCGASSAITMRCGRCCYEA